MSRIIIVSNRLPVKIRRREGGGISFQQSEGGLATGLSSLQQDSTSLWIGWPGTHLDDSAEEQEVIQALADRDMAPVFLSETEIREYYEGFSNETLWPTFHYFNQYALYNEAHWETYVEVNRKFCREIVKHVQPGDMIWIHDYHLLLLPEMIRRELPGANIGFFQHIPFPSYEIFRLLPWRKQLLEGMLGADLVGFHTFDDMRHFLSAVNRLLGRSNLYGRIEFNGRSMQVDAFPMGIDYEKYSSLAASSATRRREKKYRETLKNQKVMLSIDRLDYSKGIPQRLLAFEQFLQEHPEFHGAVSLIMIVVPSRDKVEKYKELKEKVDQLVGRINSSYRTMTWNPIQYFYRSFSIGALVTLYKIADLALVTPLRDGMNLVSKEYIASKVNQKGVLILSEMAGASKELSDAVLINPNDITQMVEAICSALNMPEEEQVQRMKMMQSIVRHYNVHHWAKLFLERLAELGREERGPRTHYMTVQENEGMIVKFREAGKRLVFLDYDGTLMPFSRQPHLAKPDAEILELLGKLGADARSRLVVISGRDRRTLEEWLGGLNVDLIAEHGVWLKERGGDWMTIHGVSNEWKDKIRPVFELYVNRTPGSSIEEKDYSLVWHYRRVEPGLADMRARELVSHLSYLASNINLQVLEGDKVVEIKNLEINKGTASAHWLEKFPSDFIFAIGDDRTDEDTFRVMPEDAYVIKVGDGKTAAKYSVASYSQVRVMLRRLAEASGGNESPAE